jgi:hypothetical protein
MNFIRNGEQTAERLRSVRSWRLTSHPTPGPSFPSSLGLLFFFLRFIFRFVFHIFIYGFYGRLEVANLLPNWGILFTPKIRITMTSIIISSVAPRVPKTARNNSGKPILGMHTPANKHFLKNTLQKVQCQLSEKQSRHWPPPGVPAVSGLQKNAFVTLPACEFYTVKIFKQRYGMFSCQIQCFFEFGDTELRSRGETAGHLLLNHIKR